MTGRDWSRAPIYASRDLHAAEVNGYERGRTDGYLDGYADGKAGAQVEADAEAAAFAGLVSRTFRGGVPHAELQARRDGYDSTTARRAREVAAELDVAVAASIASPLALAGTHAIPAPWRAAA